LSLAHNSFNNFTNCVERLVNLTVLNLYNNSIVGNSAISKLSKLTSLDLSSNGVISDDRLRGLTQLIRLNLDNNTMISDNCLMRLTNIRDLALRWSRITNQGISNLTQLTCLQFTPEWVSYP
jgi:Leucine-rich repeat (LRR) protein